MFYIVYIPEDHQTLAIAQCFDYEAEDYHLASRNKFSSEEEAVEYAKKLAVEHNKNLKLPNSYHDYLD